MAEATQSEDTCQRFQSYGFDTHLVQDGHDLDALAAAYITVHRWPQFIEIKTVIGRGIPEVAGTPQVMEKVDKFLKPPKGSVCLPKPSLFLKK